MQAILSGWLGAFVKPILLTFFNQVVVPLIQKAEGSIDGVPGVVLQKVTADIEAGVDAYLA